MNILNNINEEILGVCEVDEIGGEIEEAALVTARILNRKSKVVAAKKAQNTASVSVVAPSTINVESQIENSPNTDENTGNLGMNNEISASSDNVNNASNDNPSNIDASHDNTNTTLPITTTPILQN